MPEIELSCPYEGGKHEIFATMYILGQDGKIEDETLKKGRDIKQAYIDKHEGRILSDIANDSLYLRHLPDSFHADRKIDASRFVMINTEMGQRLSDQRNHFAHGDLDKEFIGLSLLDLIYMEYVIYAMRLKYYGIDDNNIRKSINELFHLSFAI